MEAIRCLPESFNISAQDAKLLLETLEAEISSGSQLTPLPLPDVSASADTLLKAEITRLPEDEQKIEVVKYVKDHLKTGLREALPKDGSCR
jgi:ribosomal protein L7/L12